MIMHALQKQIIMARLNLTSGTCFFITGGGSNLPNLDKYCLNFFGLTIKNLEKNNINKDQEKIEETFSACLGALRIIKDGWETEAIPRPVNKYSKKAGFFNKIFGKYL